MKNIKNNRLLALVTGATGDIGGAVVKKLIDSGYFILAVGRNKDAGNKLVKNYSSENLEFIEANLMDKKSIPHIYSHRIFDEYLLDTIVLCAGVLKTNCINAVTQDEWMETMEINVNSTFSIAQKGIELMKINGKGNIVIIGSRWGESGASKAIAYSTSKSALRGMINSMQLELKNTSIRSVLISPGSVAGKMSNSIDSKSGKLYLKPEDVAETVSFVISAPPIVNFGEISIKSRLYDL